MNCWKNPKFSLPTRPIHASLLLVASLALASAPMYAQEAAPSPNAVAAAPEEPNHRAVVEDIVARVNDRVISTSDYDHAEQELEQQARQRNMSPADLEDQRKNLLRDLIDNQLLLSKGKQLGLTGEAETIRQLDEIRKQNHLDSMEALEKAVEQQNLSFADFKQSIQNRIVTSSVIRQEVGGHINITDGELRAYYDQHLADFSTPETVTLSEILIPTPDADNATQVADAKTKAEDAEAQVKGGKDFADVAKGMSGGSTAAQGGTLGQYGKGQLAKALEDAVFPLQAGQVSSPIRTRQGWIILKVDAHQAAGQQPYEKVRGQVEDALGQQMMTPALRAYLLRLREEAYIEVKAGYNDVGASPNEVRPVYSAYQPPTKKKKKPVHRTRFTGGRGRLQNRTHADQAAMDSAKDVADAKAAGAPAGTPSLADVAAGQGNGKAVAAPKTQEAGKREKVRFGQSPRETLPAAGTRSEDAGASAENGNASSSETAQVEPSQVAGGAGDTPEDQQPQDKKTKTRFLARSKETKVDKKQRVAEEKKKNAYPFTPAPATADEISDKKTQAAPLGLNGDTTKKAPKPKPTEKTRLSDQAGKPKADDQTPAASAPPTNASPTSAPGYPTPAPAPSTDSAPPSNTAPAPAPPMNNNQPQ